MSALHPIRGCLRQAAQVSSNLARDFTDALLSLFLQMPPAIHRRLYTDRPSDPALRQEKDIDEMMKTIEDEREKDRVELLEEMENEMERKWQMLQSLQHIQSRKQSRRR